MNRTLSLASVTLAASLVASVALAQTGTTPGTQATPPSRTAPAKPAATTPAPTADIVDTAVAAGSFKTLAAALQAAGLVEALKGKGPFTVFAPTDEAFAKLPKGTLEELLKPENKARLTAILTYHVVPAKAMAADVVKMSNATTLQGQRVDLKAANGKVTVDGANVVTADIACTNGVIHVIDRVILPVEANAYNTAKSAGMFNTLIAAIDAAGMSEMFKQPGQMTILAPTDDAFKALPAGALEMLLKPENKAKLAEVLAMHVVPGAIAYSDAVVKLPEVRVATGSPLKVVAKDGKVMIANATVVKTDIESSNAVIHVIDRVILPASMAPAGATTGAESTKTGAESR
jgi:uncharacterized surface protein with fasciclin (FAS1) repeats